MDESFQRVRTRIDLQPMLDRANGSTAMYIEQL